MFRNRFLLGAALIFLLASCSGGNSEHTHLALRASPSALVAASTNPSAAQKSSEGAKTQQAQSAKWLPYDFGSEPSVLSAAAKKGEEAIAAMYERLSQKKPPTPGGSLSEGVVIRRDRTPILLRKIGDAHKVEMGFTSARLRNPANAPRPWAAALVHASAPAGNKPETKVVDLGEKVGLLSPITLQPACVRCHGNPESFPEDLRAKLTELYPEDKATGYSAGELGGYVWVEIPKRQ